MIIKTLLLATLAVATPLVSPNLASHNPSDSETEIYKSSPASTTDPEFLLSTNPNPRHDSSSSDHGYLDTPSLSTASAAPAACTTGPSATATDGSGFDITGYTKIVGNTTAYEVEKTWYKKHFVSGPHWFGYSHTEGQFGAWKCQFTCNAAPEGNCNGYFVWYEGVGSGDGKQENMKCNLFDAVIPKEVLVPSNATGVISGGAFDRICQEHVTSN
ncbi:hypothetical protein QBC40DRAFT_251542 [Triangularia verruculosa]|uniref:Uncharacterized protein n=1 Tax=Triangularia verruculosa TaxID=2587418 RepID=A0AAN6XNZ6_9PEZI|nr:hypothetical protein QBC40DRAFT_251542 [Triangularia verruculosa]